MPKSMKKTRFVGMSKSGSSSEDEESSAGLSSIKAGPSEECKLVYLNWSELCLDGPSDLILLGTHSTIRSGNDKRQDCSTMQVRVLSCPFHMNTLSSSGFSIFLCFKCMCYSHATLVCYKALLKLNPAVCIWMTLPMMEAKFSILWDPMPFLSCGISPQHSILCPAQALGMHGTGQDCTMLWLWGRASVAGNSSKLESVH